MADLIGTVRRNHGLEHATIAVLLRRIGRDIRTVGRATRDGYYLYADVPTELLEECADEALRRLKAGEGHLAVSSFCGTNLAVAGALTAGASLVTIGRSARRRPPAERHARVDARDRHRAAGRPHAAEAPHHQPRPRRHRDRRRQARRPRRRQLPQSADRQKTPARIAAHARSAVGNDATMRFVETVDC